MNQRTHVWSADEVRSYCAGSVSLCRYRNRFGTENVVTVQACFPLFANKRGGSSNEMKRNKTKNA